MPEYDNTNRGAAFPNKKKNTDKHPDMTGSLNVDGTDYWVSVWDSTSKQGMPYLSIQVRRKDEVAAAVHAPAHKDKQLDVKGSYEYELDQSVGRANTRLKQELDDDIPF